MWLLVRVYHLNLEKYEKHWTWISIYVTHSTTEILMTNWLTVHVTHPWSSRWAMQKDFLSLSSRCKLPLPLLFFFLKQNKTKNLVPWNSTLPGSEEGKFLAMVMLKIRILEAQHRNHNTEAQNLFKIQNMCSWTRRGVCMYIHVPFLWGRAEAENAGCPLRPSLSLFFKSACCWVFV